MISYEQALKIAQSINAPDGYRLDEHGSRFDEGWLFGWERLTDGIEPPGGPSPFVIHAENGAIEELILPSDRGFEVLDKTYQD